jgi:hypothetical protein
MRVCLSISCVLWCCMLSGCGGEPSGLPIKFIFPQGFRGGVILVIDNNRGVTVPVTNGYCEYIIPPSGKMLINESAASPFLKWHRTIAQFADGTMLPIGDEQRPLPGDPVAFYEGTYYSGERAGTKETGLRSFVGTHKEYIKFLHSDWPEAGPVR